MSENDTLLVGLSGQERSPNDTPPTAETRLNLAEIDTAERLVRRLNGDVPDRHRAETDKPRIVEANLSTATTRQEIPAGAVTAPGGLPFTDFDSASYKATQMQNQTGDQFFVCALSPTQFVVIAQASAPGSSRARTAEVEPDDDEQPAYRDIPIKELKITDFPAEHPVHTCGLATYKKYMKNGFRFKPAYRSMWPLLSVVSVGAFLYLFPVIAITLLPQDMINTIVESISPEQFTMFVSYTGAALGGFALLKVLFQRHVHRYMLLDGFAKYEYGIIKRETSKIAYNNISNYEIKQSVLGRLLNYGDMELASPGTNDSEIQMCGLLAPRLIESVLEGKIDEARRANR